MARDRSSSAPARPDAPRQGRAGRAPAAPAPARGPLGRFRRRKPGAAPKKTRAEKRAARKARRQQYVQAWKVTKASDPRMPLYVIGTAVLVLAVVLALGLLVTNVFLAVPLALVLALMAGLIVFGRRAQGAAFGQIEGQLGAAAGVLQNLRGDWRVQPAVAVNQHQDLVHRVLGRPGVVLVSEGTATRTRHLVLQERKRVTRVLGDFPVYDLHVGDGEGEVPLRRLQKHLSGMPRNVKGAQVNAAEKRLQALAAKGTLPVPKGPLPMQGKMPRPPKGMR